MLGETVTENLVLSSKCGTIRKESALKTAINHMLSVA